MLKIIYFFIVLGFINVKAADVCITNFDKKVCSNFQVMPSVIVKTTLSKEQLITKLDKPLKQIAFLKESNLFLVESDDALTDAKWLSKQDYVIYAQANISQIKENSNLPNGKQLNRKIQPDPATKFHLKTLWKKSKGEGVKIAIIDDGFNLQHEDLRGVHVGLEYDVGQKQLNSSPKIPLDQHGTQVAGVIFAQHNKRGIDGIAPKAELIAIRQINNVTSQIVLAFTVAHLAKADIINCSWKSPLLLEPVYDVITDLARHGREGKGIAIVFSAGNNGKEILPQSTEASIHEAVVVGATQSYSNYGQTVDFRLRSGVKTTKQNGYGYFGGTSAVAPIISGLLALKMSQQNNRETSHLVKQLREELNGRQ